MRTAAAAALAALSLLAAAQASAEVLISNTGQPQAGTVINTDYAQGFATGSNAKGYTLTHVFLHMNQATGTQPNYTVSIHSDSSSKPGGSLGTLTQQGQVPSNPGGVRFNAPGSGIELDSGTTYWLQLDVTTRGKWQFRHTSSDSEDSGGAAGWSIRNTALFRGDTIANWNSPGTKQFSLSIAVHGHANTDPTLANPIPDQVAKESTEFSYAFPANTFNDADGDTLTYAATDGEGTALPTWLNFDAGTRTFSGTPPATVTEMTVKVTATAGGVSVNDTFKITFTSKPVITSVAIVSKPRIDANTDGTKETYGAGQNIAVEVTWDEAVTWDTSTAGAGIRVQLGIGDNNRGAELVTGGATSGTARTLRFAYTVVASDTDSDGVTVNANNQGDVVRLRDGATMKKADGSIDALLTHAGLGAQLGHQVAGGTAAPANSAPTFVGADPGTGNAPPLTRVSSPVRKIDFRDADGDPLTFTLTSADRDDIYVPGSFKWAHNHVWFKPWANCALANLSPPVPDGYKFSFTYTATDPDGASGSVTGVFNVRTTGCPSFSSAKVGGTTLAITLSGTALGHAPVADEFEVKVAGAAVALADTNPVAVRGRIVTLTLAAAPAAGQTVTVSYTPNEDSMTVERPLGAGPMGVAFTDQTVDDNAAPTVANPISDRAALVGTAFSYAFPANAFADGDGDTLRYTATKDDGNALPSWLTFADGTRTFSGTPQSGNAGTVSVKVTATDGFASVSDSFDIEVRTSNAAPTVAHEIPEQAAVAGTAFSYTFPANTFADAEDDTLSYSATKGDGNALPSWLTFTADTRTFSGTPLAVGTETVKVTATDGIASVSDSFDITVSAVPAIGSVAIVSKPRIDANDDGTKETYGAGQTIAVDVTWEDNVAWNIQASGAGISVQLGIGGNTRAAELVTGGTTSGTSPILRFAYTVAASDTDSDGVEVKANDLGNVVLLRNGATVKTTNGLVNARLAHAGLEAQSDHLVAGGTSDPGNSAPTFGGTAPGSKDAPPGARVTLRANKSDFSDADDDPLTFTLSADRDDIYLPGGLTWEDSIVSIEVMSDIVFQARQHCALANLAPAPTSPHTTTVTATATDLDGATGSTTATFRTSFSCPSFSRAKRVGSVLTITLDADAPGGTPGADEFEVKVGGAVVALAATNPVAVSGRTVTLTLAAAPAAGQTVTVSYTPDEDAMTAELAGNAPMAVAFTDETVTESTTPTVANPIPDQAVVAGTAFSYTFPANTFTDGDGDTLSYAATKSDGNPLPSWLTFTADTRKFSGTPQSANIGTETVKVTATDGSASVSDTFDIEVRASNAAPTVANPIPNQAAAPGMAFSYTFPANTFADGDGNTLSYSATDGDGNALPYWLTFDADTRTFSGTPQSSDTGTETVKVTASDRIASVSNSFNIVVAEGPTAQAGADRTVEPGATVTLNGSGTDSDGTIQGYAWSQVSGTSVTLQNAGTARATFTAPAVGTLVFRLTVTDNDGATGSDDVTITVRDASPLFAGGMPALRLEPGEAMAEVKLPEATGGNGGPYSYALTSDPAGLAGLSFDSTTRILSGTPDVEKGRWTFTYTAYDGDTNTGASDAAQLTFRVTVGMAPEAQRRAVESTVAALATRTVSSALDNIGDRLGDGVPAVSLTLAGEAVPITGPGAAATGRDAPHGPNPGTCPDGFGRGYGLAGFGNGFGAGGCIGHAGRDVDADAVLSASAFSLPLGPTEGEAGFDPKAPLWSVWGRGDLGHFAGRPEPGMHFSGRTRTGWFGVDARGPIRGSGGSRLWVAGLAVSRGTSRSDYSFEGGADPSERGRLETQMSALWPYGRWTFESGLELRGMAGAGAGKLRHVPGGGDPAEESKLRMWTVSMGLKRQLQPLNGIDLAAQGDASFVRMETARGEQTIDGQRTDSWRIRAGVEGSPGFLILGLVQAGKICYKLLK